ncbi:carboxymuconolactone decarboxylase family protein [Actinoallomurus iriomotensis]|uniref:carboxymuconolactone decarboxylase family protein n=1 Tax=Actinoallomurus iriomotensis TaxID=478107 RepID=UPI0025521C6B|nr:carboxymuconolactone decarboxylase family protein [Actinoallomurus iriomotensis]
MKPQSGSKAGDVASDYLSAGGDLSEDLGRVLRQSPAFGEAHLRMATLALVDGELSRKTREFILLAANLNATHLNIEAAREHLRRAKAAGAGDEELIEVIQCASLVGVHAVVVGLGPLQRLAPVDLSRELTPSEERLKRSFEERRGYWSSQWDQLLRLGSDYFAAVLEFSAAPAASGALSALDREYVYMAFDCSPTHMFEPGLELHMRNALELGATPADLLAVLKLVSGIGFEAATAGYRLLAEVNSPPAG